MAKGYQQHKARQDAINFWGKDLARRAKRKCELCEESDSLKPHDTQPDEEPALDTLVLLCPRCTDFVGGAEQDPRTLRFLEQAVWNETPVVAGLARELIAKVDTDWARQTLELF